MMYVSSDAERPRYAGNQPTEAEELAAYRSFVANSGRYTVTGNQISFEAFVAKDPNYMANWNMTTRANAVNVTYSIANEILTLRWTDSTGANAGRSATLRRPRQP